MWREFFSANHKAKLGMSNEISDYYRSSLFIRSRITCDPRVCCCAHCICLKWNHCLDIWSSEVVITIHESCPGAYLGCRVWLTAKSPDPIFYAVPVDAMDATDRFTCCEKELVIRVTIQQDTSPLSIEEKRISLTQMRYVHIVWVRLFSSPSFTWTD